MLLLLAALRPAKINIAILNTASCTLQLGHQLFAGRVHKFADCLLDVVSVASMAIICAPSISEPSISEPPARAACPRAHALRSA